MNEEPNARAPRPAADNASSGNDDLTHLLRLGDPAADDSEPSPMELAEMRRTIIETTEQTGPTHGLRPWLAGGLRLQTSALPATVGAIVLAVWLAWFLGTSPAPQVADLAGPGADSGAPTAIGRDALDGPATTIAPQRPAETTSPEKPTIAREGANPLVVAAPPESPALIAAAPPAAERESRTVQFTSPRGTRIIWTLDPDFESPIAGQEARQEQGK